MSVGPPRTNITTSNRHVSHPVVRRLCCVAKYMSAGGAVGTEAKRGGRPGGPQVEGVQPLASPDDCLLAEEIVKDDPAIQALLREQYNVTDLALVACDPWSGTAAPSLPELYLHEGPMVFAGASPAR